MEYYSSPQFVSSNAAGGSSEPASNFIGRWINSINGSAATNQANIQEAIINRAFNAEEAEKQRQHELFMSNTAYQRAAEDMKKAGINPASLSGMVSGSGGASGSSSSAATGTAGSLSGNGKGIPGVGLFGTMLGLIVRLAGIKMQNENALARSIIYSKNRVKVAKINAAARRR